MIKTGLFLLLSLFFNDLLAQRVVNKQIASEGDILLTEGISIPKIDRGYTAWLPDIGPVRGLVVFTHPRRDTINSEFIIDHALSNQLGVLYACTDNRLEFFFEPGSMQEIENYIHEVLSGYQIPAGNLLYCGMSLEGTRALKLAVFGSSGRSRHKLVPKAIAICDSPLDMIRFHTEMTRAKELRFNSITTNEGTWVSGYLERNLGGTPEDSPDSYIRYSPYSYRANGGPNLHYLEDIAVRAYTEPDVAWWMANRGKDYYSMNAIDLAALINQLSIQGNRHAELITTENKGILPDGTRHPHSWSIVDEKELIDWFSSMIK